MFGCLGVFGIIERALPHRVFGTRAKFLLLLTLHKLFIMQRFFYYYYYYLRFALFYVAQGNDPAGLYPLASPRLDGGLRQHFITPCRGLRHHSAGLH